MFPQPTIHEQFLMGDCVEATINNQKFYGIIEGVSSVGIFWTYIIILDRKFDQPGIGEVEAIALPGQMLRLINRKAKLQ